MDERAALLTLADDLGVATRYVDGLARPVSVSTETLVRVCGALGAHLTRADEAPSALQEWRSRGRPAVPPVLVAWDGRLPPLSVGTLGPLAAELHFEGDGVVPLEVVDGELRAPASLPFGYHRLVVHGTGGVEECTIITSPSRSWHRPGSTGGSWGIGCHLAALRSRRSRTVADLADLERVCRWVGERGGDLVTVLPLLPTFNQSPAEPSPYSPVTRLFWSELILDLGQQNRPTPAAALLDVTRGDAEVRAALGAVEAPDRAGLDTELLRYAQFRGAQARLGRNWREWPDGPRRGRLAPQHIDPDEERFHLLAQLRVRDQLGGLLRRLGGDGVRVGLDLAVGVHPDGYDLWSRRPLFALGMSVGAPPDPGFPSGQDWGFPPLLPDASRLDGHRYVAASIAHQATLAGVLRIDHVMALARLYWIPHGMGLDQGTYVNYPSEELFAVVTLESHRHQCEIIGENLGTVPERIHQALPRHDIRGMSLAVYEAMSPDVRPPTADQVALIGTHDTPTLAGWIEGIDIDERVRCGLLAAESAPEAREARAAGVQRLADTLGVGPDDRKAFLVALLEWLGRSPAPLVIPWIEDLWLEAEQVNLPGTRSSERPNWQRPLSRVLDDVLTDAAVDEPLRRLAAARASSG
jgi:4-alpha-glucanotransferase